MEETHSMGDYLGCPIIDSRVTKETFVGVLSKSIAQLPKWKANSLSQAGRTVLIQSNLASKASLQMQIFSLPKKILVKLDANYRNFFWNKDNSAKSKNLIGWNKVCQPKVFGGVGFRKTEVNNVALEVDCNSRVFKQGSLKDNYILLP